MMNSTRAPSNYAMEGKGAYQLVSEPSNSSSWSSRHVSTEKSHQYGWGSPGYGFGSPQYGFGSHLQSYTPAMEPSTPPPPPASDYYGYPQMLMSQFSVQYPQYPQYQQYPTSLQPYANSSTRNQPPQLCTTLPYSPPPPQYHQSSHSSPPMYMQQQYHTASYLFDDMSERKVTHGGPTSEVYVLDEMYEENLVMDKEKKEEEESKEPNAEGFLDSFFPEVCILDFDASFPVEGQDYSEDLSLISESSTNSSPIPFSKNFGSVSADNRAVNSSVGKTARVEEVTSFLPTNGCTLSEEIDPVQWRVNKYQLKGITMDVEAALSPSKRLHRALEAMSANATEATVDIDEAAGGMELTSNGCTKFLATENILSSVRSPRIQSRVKTNELVLGTLATSGHGYPMFQSSSDVNHGNEQLKVNGEMTNIAPLKLLVSIEEMCWVFEDERGTEHGPHSLEELLNWHQSSYLQDSLMIYHVDSKLGPFTLASLAAMWGTYKSACPYSSMLEENITDMLGVVPRRYGWNGGEIGFDTYFSMARGNATLPAKEMTKWFDTNYPFIVPELGPDTMFSAAAAEELFENAQLFFICVLSPTRELTVQISEQFEALGFGIGLKCSVLVEGVDMMHQAISLTRCPHVVVATPGRFLDHFSNTRGFSFRASTYLVLEEADKLLNREFEKSIDEIMKALPRVWRTYLFSACNPWAATGNMGQKLIIWDPAWGHNCRKEYVNAYKIDRVKTEERERKGLPVEYYCKSLYWPERGAFFIFENLGLETVVCNSCKGREVYYSDDVDYVPVVILEGMCEVGKEIVLRNLDFPMIVDHVFFCEYSYDPAIGAVKKLPANVKRWSATFCGLLQGSFPGWSLGQLQDKALAAATHADPSTKEKMVITIWDPGIKIIPSLTLGQGQNKGWVLIRTHLPS